MSRGGYTQRYYDEKRNETLATSCLGCAVGVPLAILFFVIQVVIILLLVKWIIL